MMQDIPWKVGSYSAGEEIKPAIGPYTETVESVQTLT
jgi:hypothetical protein